MKTTKLLTVLTVVLSFTIQSLYSQCSFITVNGSTQDPKTVCAPVDFTMEAQYKFLLPVDTTLVRVLFRWNDGTGATTTVPGSWNSSSDSIWASASHFYPPTDECSRTAEAIIIYDGELCESSGYQSQIFSTWGTDEENSGVLSTEPVVYYVCEGDPIVDVTFEDNSTFNCNINIENDRPNRYYRWVEFVYNTYIQGGDRIPDVTVRDPMGVNHQMTDVTGNFITNLYGPIEIIPIPADGPNQTSYPISAPPGGVAGDIFEITLRNWNVCNPYDNNPIDGIPPVDIVNGDNLPIFTTARIEIIAPPPLTVASLFEFCTGDNIILTATTNGGAQVRWYKDPNLDTLLYTGNNFDPSLPPVSIDNEVAGNYTFYVTSIGNMCESAPSVVNLVIYQSPDNANAGPDLSICSDSTTLRANNPVIGTGIWSTTGSAILSNPSSPTTKVTNLSFGANTFRWTITNGLCSTSDVVRITSDRQPSPANAGAGRQLCGIDPVVLNAAMPTNGGTGLWNLLNGAGGFSDNTNPNSSFSGIAQGINLLSWRVFSRYGACPVTIDTIEIREDLPSGPANAGNDIVICESSEAVISANPALNGGTGNWSVISGTIVIETPTSPNSSAHTLSYGSNLVSWTVRSQMGICPADTDTLQIIRFQSPGPANAGIDMSFCLTTQDTLKGNAPVIGTGEWFVISNPSGVPPVFVPNRNNPNSVFSISPGNEGRYELEWVLVNGVCTSRDRVVLDFGIPVPSADAGNNASICGNAHTLSGNIFPGVNGTWTQLSGPEPVLFTPGTHINNAIASVSSSSGGIYLLEWLLESGSCPAKRDTVEIEFKASLPAPALSAQLACGPSAFTITVPVYQANRIVRWYSSNTSSSWFYIGQTYSTPLLTEDTSYYVSIFDTITGCESPRTRQILSINETPGIPDLFGDTLCGPDQAIFYGTAPLPANSIIWYADAAASIPLDTTNVFPIDIIANTTLFARSYSTTTHCISDPAPVSSVVYPEVSPPVTTADSACGNSSFDLHAVKSNTSNSLFWYNSAGNLIYVGDSMFIPTLSNTTSYFVAEYNPSTECLSDQSELLVTIHPNPSIPQINDTSSCGISSFTLAPVPNAGVTTYRWYNQPVSGTMLSESDTYKTPVLIANATYFVSGFNENTGCEGPREQIDLTIYPNPGIIDILGPTVVLKNQTNVVFFIVNGQPGSNFTWSIPSEITTETNMNDFVRLGFPNTGSFILAVFETTINGCIGTPVYHSVTVINDSIAVDIGNHDQGACTAESFEIRPWLFGGTPPYVYSWTGDTQYLTSTSTLFTTFAPPGTGQYKLALEVVDINLKVARDSVLITVYESPLTSITNTDTIACVDENYAIRTNNTGSEPFTYLWTGPVHSLSGYTIAEPVYTPRHADTASFYYTLTDENGCKAYDSITIVSDAPVAGFNVLTDPGCSPINVGFENTSQGATKYLWDFGDGVFTNQVNPTHLFENTSSEINYNEINLRAESALGCFDNAANYVMVWPNPVADIAALPQNNCNPAHVMLVSTPGNSVYYWNFGESASDTATSRFNVYHTFYNASDRDVTFTTRVVTQSSLYCFDTATIDITVYATPVAEFTVSPEEATIPNNIFTLDNLTLGNWQYIWDFGDGNASTLKEPGRVEYENSGVYNISLRAMGEHCSDSMNTLIRLHPAPPVAMFKGADDGCQPHTVTLVNSSEYADSYLWEFGDGSISTAREPSYTYYEPGIYKIKLTVSGMGGTDVFTDTTRVFILPNSFFDLAPRYVYINDEPVHYFNLSENADVFEWDFGDGHTSTDLNPQHVYKEAGTFDVTLKVWTKNNCFDLYVMENAVFTEPSGMVEYPNAIRPNSPLEENRVFKPGIIDHVDKYHLMIFNRWGELIFESFDQEIGWDGFYQGKLAKQDVYVWKVRGTYTDGKGFEKTGDVTLLY